MKLNKSKEIDVHLLTEDEETEFKTSFGKETIETLVAFANHRGGSVIIGISNNKEIVGIDIGKETIQKYLNQIQSSTVPSIIPDILQIGYQNKNLLILSIKEFPLKPVSVKGRYYKRVSNSNHLMSLKEI